LVIDLLITKVKTSYWQPYVSRVLLYFKNMKKKWSMLIFFIRRMMKKIIVPKSIFI